MLTKEQAFAHLLKMIKARNQSSVSDEDFAAAIATWMMIELRVAQVDVFTDLFKQLSPGEQEYVRAHLTARYG